MRILRGYIPTMTMIAVLSFGTTFANAGLIISDFTGDSKTRTEQPCTDKKDKVDYGIIIVSVAGAIVNSLTGIIIVSAVDTQPVDCGIIIVS